MGWKDRQRRMRVQSAGDQLRAAWAALSPVERAEFLAELAEDIYQAAPITPATPDAPLYADLAAERHFDPVGMAIVSPTGLLHLVRQSQAEHEQALASIGATSPGGAL